MMAQFPGVGDKLPTATLTASDGTPFDLAQYAGRKLVLFFLSLIHISEPTRPY